MDSVIKARNITLERLLLALFVASGFAGLIYQSIWSHYLGLTLGHAAYAQTLVLAIFMGGMAVGSWVASHFGIRWQRLIFIYAVVEILIGLAGLGFHSLFLGYTVLSQEVVYPALDSVPAIQTWQWLSAAVLITPQSILLGMTFPLMSGGYLRIAPRADGEILGGLYFTNSIGAACGALVATFVLLPWVGMPGAMIVGGVLNLLVGVVAWWVSRRADVLTAQTDEFKTERSNSKRTPLSKFSAIMLMAAAITGATSFIYEIGWIRLLNQALGTTVHSFELMLAAFIFGLAFGGWWIRARSKKITAAIQYAAYAQIWMGVAALLSIPIFAQSFHWVGALMSAVPRDETGYTLFSLGSAGIALLVMFPAAFFAGMTLPLFTMALLRKDEGEASIGRVYAANTFGAILGVFLATYVLIPFLGLRLAVTTAALIDVMLGFYLLRYVVRQSSRRIMAAALACSVAGLAISLHFGQPDLRTLASGVYRHGNIQLDKNIDIHFFKDGKTATIAFFSSDTRGTIATNGKPDASIQLDKRLPATEDEITMVMAAALPLAAHPHAKEVGIIGWGSGLTTHAILGSEVPQQVDTIEIEQAMVDGARWYGKHVQRAYEDPRSHLHIDDARTFFSTGKRTYDVIISEPSNPWVSGVAGLFTHEFYRFLGNHLKQDGILVQWLQAYEMDDELLATIMAALLQEFAHIEVYLTNSGDLLFLASAEPIAPLDYTRLQNNALRLDVERVNLAAIGDFKVRKVASRSTLEALVALYGAEAHSDFYPEVSLKAPRTRFMKKNVTSFDGLMRLGMPVLELTNGRVPASLKDDVVRDLTTQSVRDHWLARFVHNHLVNNINNELSQNDSTLAEQVNILQQLSRTQVNSMELASWLTAVAVTADFSIGYLPKEDHYGLWVQPNWINLDQQGNIIQSVMAAYEAAAQRDGLQMQVNALAALELIPEDTPGVIREQMLVIAILGALEQKNFTEALRIEREVGRKVSPESQYSFARSYLMAWGDIQSQKDH